MVDRDALVAYLDGLLESHTLQDYGPTGLQVEGRREIAKLVTGVTASEALLVAARERGADAVLVHHGILWSGAPLPLAGAHGRRVRTLMQADMSLYAYHLPLDRHGELGNNFLVAKKLGLYSLQPFAEHGGAAIGYRGRYPEPVPVAELVAKCRELFGQEPTLLGDGPDPLSTLGIVTGGAQKDLHTAIAAGLDAFLTGEASEWCTHVARENRVWYLACGHHATERLGVQALGAHLAERFGIEVEYVEIPNPV